MPFPNFQADYLSRMAAPVLTAEQIADFKGVILVHTHLHIDKFHTHVHFTARMRINTHTRSHINTPSLHTSHD